VSAFPEASRRVGLLWFSLFALAWLAIWTVQLAPVQLLLPLQLDTEGGDWIAGVVGAGVVLSVGGVAGVIAGPLAGRLSDRTRLRWGRRRPWAVGGSALAAVGLLLTGVSTGPWAIGGSWVVASIGIAVASTAYTALIADQLTTQRGAASAAASSAQAIGVVIGVGAVVLLGLGITPSYVALAVLIAVVGGGAALLLPDPEHAHLPEARAVTGHRRSSSRGRDFGWLLAGRLVVNVGNALGTSLLLFFLLYGIGVPAAESQDDLLILTVVYTVFVVLASVAVGVVSDRAGHRRSLTALCALVQAGSGVVILVSPDLLTTSIAAGIMGAGYGGYMAVSLALATDLLHDPEEHARDLGLVNVSANLGQLAGPLLGAGLVALVGGFWLLFAAAAALSAVGGVMTLAIRPYRGDVPESSRPSRERGRSPR